MTAAGCGHGELLLSLTLELAAVKCERDSWRLVSLASLAHVSELEHEIAMLGKRDLQWEIQRRLAYEREQHVAQNRAHHRARRQGPNLPRSVREDRAEVWADHTDLRREDCASW